MRTETPFCILSACRPEYSAEANDARSEALAAQLRGRNLDFMAVSGFWQGAAERSYLVLTPPNDGGRAQALVYLLANRYGQDSVLHVDANRAACLLPVTGSGFGEPEPLGDWREVDDVSALDAYTRTADGRTWAAL